MKIALIVAAGGSSERFQGKSKKSKSNKKRASKMSAELLGQTVLSRSISLFDDVENIDEVIVCVPAAEVLNAKKELRNGSKHKLSVVAGGKTRAESIYRGLSKVSNHIKWVMIHDGARPLCLAEDVRRLIKLTNKDYDAGLLASKVTSTLKEARKNRLDVKRTVDRSNLYQAETPQLVKKKKLAEAYKILPDSLQQTDDVGLIEQIKGKIKIVTHENWNPKITIKKDIELAEAFLRSKGKTVLVKTGIGQDTHRLVKGNTFYLGGIELHHSKGPLGHSDGDALLHAVIDAILGATSKGDIGDWFSDKDKKFKNIRSEKLLKAVLKNVNEEGWTVQHVDTVITLERPKLGEFKNKIKENLMNLMGLTYEQVSVKAKTAEGLGPEGIGQAITCLALVTMERKK